MNESLDVLNQFKMLGVKSAIISKIDSTRRLGNVIACAYEKKIILSNFGVGPTLADSLIGADPNYLYHILQTQDLQARRLIYSDGDNKQLNYKKEA